MDEMTRVQVAALLKAGDKLRAQGLLVRAVRQNPQDEAAWLALAQALDDVGQRRDCLQRVLVLNPANTAAAQWLQELSPAPVPLAEVASPRPVERPPAERAIALTEPPGESAAAPPARTAPASPSPTIGSPPMTGTRGRPRWWLLSLSAALVVCIMTAAAIGLVAYQSQQVQMPLLVPTVVAQRPTVLAFPTLPPEWTATATQPTATPRPSTTPTRDSTQAEGLSATPGSPSVAPPLTHLDYPIVFIMGPNGGPSSANVTDGSSPGHTISNVSRWLGWAPDGQGLRYLDSISKAQDSIDQVGADGSQPREMARLPAGIFDVALSADGRWLAFVYMTPPGKDVRWNLDAMATDGTGRKTIESIPESTNNALLLGDWSPDGGRLALAERLCVEGPVGTSYQACDSELYVINRDGTDRQQLTTDVMGACSPRWSPDGSEIVFEMGSPDEFHTTWARLMLLRLDGSAPEMLVLDGYTEINLQEPDWSPDGKQIAFIGAKGRASIYIVPVTCFGAPKLCTWQDVTRLPFAADWMENLRWKDSPPLAGAAIPTIAAVTPLVPLADNWVPVVSFAGHDSSKTALFALGQGMVRVNWKYTGPAGSKFNIALGRESTQEIETLDGTYGSGSSVFDHFNLFPGQDYFFLVESLGQWTLDVTFNQTS